MAIYHAVKKCSACSMESNVCCNVCSSPYCTQYNFGQRNILFSVWYLPEQSYKVQCVLWGIPGIATFFFHWHTKPYRNGCRTSRCGSTGCRALLRTIRYGSEGYFPITYLFYTSVSTIPRCQLVYPKHHSLAIMRSYAMLNSRTLALAHTHSLEHNRMGSDFEDEDLHLK